MCPKVHVSKVLKHGLILIKSTCCHKFKQKRWLELYVSSNTYFRTLA